LVRDLTSYGIVVGWQLRLGAADRWQTLSHLAPPAVVLAPDGESIRREWAETHYMGKCLYRHGPGFVQVRDRRFGELRLFTIPEPEYRAAIGTLAEVAPATAVARPIMSEFLAEDLAGQVGEIAWWLPYRVRRWPNPSVIV
jgi:hypothetical protein